MKADTKENVINCFLDTNSLLHYKLFSKIDWNSLLNADRVNLIICSTVLSELDKLKYSAPNINIRNRSKKILSKLNDYIDQDNITENIFIYFQIIEPNINWSKESLNKDIPDDRIIATVLGSNSLNSSILVSSDIGLRLKAKSKNISTFELPTNQAIKINKDKNEIELSELRKKVLNLENRLPNLKLELIDDDSRVKFIKYSYKKSEQYDDLDSKFLVNKIVNNLKYIPTKQNQYKNSLISQMIRHDLIPPQNEVERYEKDLEDYKTKLLKYFEKKWLFEDINSRIFKIKFILSNIGNIPAEDIDIFIHFPDGFKIFGLEKLPKRPRKPTEPRKPLNLLEMIADNSRLTLGTDFLTQNFGKDARRLGDLSGPNTRPTIKKTNSYEVHYNINSLKHNLQTHLDSIYVYFESYDLINSFEVTYSILTNNYPNKFEDKLSIIFN